MAEETEIQKESPEPEAKAGEPEAATAPEDESPATGVAGEKPKKKAPRKKAADAEGEAGQKKEKKPRPKKGKGARERKPDVPLPPLSLWRNGQLEPLGEAQIVKGPYESLTRPDEPKEGNARRPITGKLEIEGKFKLPPHLLNDKTVIKIGDLLLHVYVLSTSATGGKNGDKASFIIARELKSEEEARTLYPPAA